MNITLYIQVQPERSEHYPDTIYGARKVKVTRRRPKPERMLVDACLIKVELEVPRGHFQTQAVQIEAPVASPVRAVS